MSALDTLPVGQKKAERGVLGRIIRRPLAAFGLVVIVVTVAAALFAPWIVPFDPNEQFFDGLTLEGAPLAPNLKFWFGTDLVGRDLFSRLIYGAQYSLFIGIVVVSIALVGGIVIGLVAGFFGGWVDTVIMRVMDVILAFPSLLLALVLVAILGPGLTNAMIAIAIAASVPCFGASHRSHSLAISA